MPTPPAEPLRIGSREGRWVLLATILASSMSFLDSTVVNVALPTLQRDFRAELSSVAWVVDAYVLTLTAFILLGGSFGDIFGRRRALRLGLIVFSTGSVLCGLAPTLLLLDLARAVQGLGGALLVPSSLAILTASFDPSERGRAVGLWASLSGIGAAIGPLAGGLLVDAISWRGIFFLNVPIAVFVFVVALPKVPESRNVDAVPHIDLPGAGIAALFLAGLTFALIEGSQLGWASPAVLSGFVVGGLGFVAFLLTERRSRHPMLALSLFANRTFSAVNVATLAIYAALGGAALYLVLDVQQGRGFSAVVGGASLLPVTLMLLIGSPMAGRLADRVGPRVPMTIGPALAGTGLLLAAATAHTSSYWTSVFPSVLIFAVGLALTVAPLTTAVLSALGPSHAGIASGVNSAVSRFGGLVAVAILPALSLAGFTHGLEQRLAFSPVDRAVRIEILADRAEQGALSPPAHLSAGDREFVREAVRASFADGFRWVMLVCALLLFAGAAISFVELRPTARPPDDAASADRSGDPLP
ncbi:MAG: MFS transporter [Actinomycetota bacterium]